MQTGGSVLAEPAASIPATAAVTTTRIAAAAALVAEPTASAVTEPIALAEATVATVSAAAQTGNPGPAAHWLNHRRVASVRGSHRASTGASVHAASSSADRAVWIHDRHEMIRGTVCPM